jgi:hypothetical protein
MRVTDLLTRSRSALGRNVKYKLARHEASFATQNEIGSI